MSESISVTVVNWEKYNPRHSKNFSWFRVELSFFTDQKLFRMSGDQRWALLCLFSLCSREGKGTFDLNPTWFARLFELHPRSVKAMLSKCEAVGIILVGSCSAFGKPLVSTCTPLGEDLVSNRSQFGVGQHSDIIQSDNSRYQTTPPLHYKTDKTDITYKTKILDLNNSKLKEAVFKAVEEWGLTLKHFGIEKDPRMDEVPIAKLIQSRGAEPTLLAIRGARKEDRSDSFDPAKHVSIYRLQRPDIFDKFVNLGSKKSSPTLHVPTSRALTESGDNEPVPDAARVREMVASAVRKLS